MSDPLFCMRCGKSLVQTQQLVRWDEYLGVRLYQKYLQCPDYGRWFRGWHSRWKWRGPDTDGYWEEEN